MKSLLPFWSWASKIVLIVVWGGEDQLCGWRSKLKFWEFRVSGPDLGDFGFLVLIWGIYVVVMVT